MTAAHTDPLPGEADILDLDNRALIEDIEGLVNLMCNSLNNAYRNDRSRDNVTRAQTRIVRSVRLLLTRCIGDVEEIRMELNDKIDEFDMLQDEYNDLVRKYENRRQASRNMVTRLDRAIAENKRQIAVLRIQNQWRQFRLINLPPQPPNDQVWLLFH